MKFGQIQSAKNTRKFLSAMDLMIIRGCCWNMDLLPWITLTAAFMSHQVGFMDSQGIEKHNNRTERVNSQGVEKALIPLCIDLYDLIKNGFCYHFLFKNCDY